MTEPAKPKRPSNGVLVLCGVATALLIAAVAIRVFMKPCPCTDQLGEADASAEAVAMASAIVDRGRTVIIDPPLTFEVPKVGVPVEVAPGGQPEVEATTGLSGAARIAEAPAPVSFGPVVLPGAPPAVSNGTKTRAPRKRAPA